MKYLIRIRDLQEKIEFLEEKLQLIYDNIEIMEKSKENITWSGDAKDTFILKYDEYLEYLKVTARNIVKILTYLKSYYSNYNEEYNNSKRRYANIFMEME